MFVEITLTVKSGDVLDQLRSELLHMPEVLECHLVSGNFDYLVKARMSAMSEYRNLLSSILNSIPVLCQSHSYVVMEEVKEASYIGQGCPSKNFSSKSSEDFHFPSLLFCVVP